MTVPDYTHLRELARKANLPSADWFTAEQVSGWKSSSDCRYIAACDPKTILALLNRLEVLEKVRSAADRYRAFRDRMAQVYGDMPARGFHVEAPTRQELDESWDALRQSHAGARSAQ